MASGVKSNAIENLYVMKCKELFGVQNRLRTLGCFEVGTGTNGIICSKCNERKLNMGIKYKEIFGKKNAMLSIFINSHKIYSYFYIKTLVDKLY